MTGRVERGDLEGVLQPLGGEAQGDLRVLAGDEGDRRREREGEASSAKSTEHASVWEAGQEKSSPSPAAPARTIARMGRTTLVAAAAVGTLAARGALVISKRTWAVAGAGVAPVM